jgi:hypothetical protein
MSPRRTEQDQPLTRIPVPQSSDFHPSACQHWRGDADFCGTICRCGSAHGPQRSDAWKLHLRIRDHVVGARHSHEARTSQVGSEPLERYKSVVAEGAQLQLGKGLLVAFLVKLPPLRTASGRASWRRSRIQCQSGTASNAGLRVHTRFRGTEAGSQDGLEQAWWETISRRPSTRS